MDVAELVVIKTPDEIELLQKKDGSWVLQFLQDLTRDLYPQPLALFARENPDTSY